MDYYLIDYENVHKEIVGFLESITKDSTMIIFYSDHSGPIPPEIVTICECKGIQLISYKVRLTGEKNALDFQLVSYLGHLIGEQETDTNYYIISHDRGYDCVCEFWEEQGLQVKRIGVQKENGKLQTKKQRNPNRNNQNSRLLL